MKNNTHHFIIQNEILDKELAEENRRLSITKASFSKKYSFTEMRKMAKEQLNLDFSNVKQIKNIEEIIDVNE